VILSENRTEIIESIGNDQYHTLYNTLSTLACGSIAWGYFKHGRGKGPTFRIRPTIPSIVAGTVIQSLGLVGFFQMFPKLQLPWTVEYTNQADANSPSNVPVDNKPKMKFAARCPMDFRSTSSGSSDPSEVFGLERITRYPFLWAFGFTAVGNALATVYWTEAIMFSLPVAFAYLGGTHQDSRFRRGKGGYLSPEKEAKTSLVPFAAFIQGKQTVSMQQLASEMKELNTLLAVGLGSLIGVRRLLRIVKK
jgi:uncharacterized membrane protein